MNALTLMVWSMSLGAIAALAVARVVDLVGRPGLSRLRAVSYHFSVFLLVLVLSGVLPASAPDAAVPLQVLQVLSGPLCVGLSTFWIHAWLRAAQRDRLMDLGLRACAWLLPLAAVAALLLPARLQLPAGAGIALLGSGITLWFTVRAWMMGDRMAHVMALGCLLTLPAIAGLYALAMDLLPLSLPTQAALALCAAASNGVTGLVLWRRDRHAWRAMRRYTIVPVLDPVTRLPAGTSLVRKLVRALERRRRTGRQGAMLAVLVFDVDRVGAQVGTTGMNEMWLTLAGRIQRHVGLLNPVGRYWDHCFVAMIETIPSPTWLRTQSLKLSAGLRHPIEVTAAGGGRVQVQPDIGLGVVHLADGWMEIEDVLDEAQRLARAARPMRWRAAMRDPHGPDILPVEHVTFTPRPVATEAGLTEFGPALH